jgi:hypothetical protein
MGLFSKKAQVPQANQPALKESTMIDVEFDEDQDVAVPQAPIAPIQQNKKQPQQVQKVEEEIDEYEEDEEEQEQAASEVQESAEDVPQKTNDDTEILSVIEQNFNDIFERLVEVHKRLDRLEAAAFRSQ